MNVMASFSAGRLLKASAALFTGQIHLLASQHAREAHSLGSYATPEWQGRAEQTLRSSSGQQPDEGAHDEHRKSHNAVTKPASRFTHVLANRAYKAGHPWPMAYISRLPCKASRGAQTRSCSLQALMGGRLPAAAGRLGFHRWPCCRCNCM